MKKSISKVRIIFFILTIAVMTAIFLFSCENADNSSETSDILTDFLIRIFHKDFYSLSAEEQSEIHSFFSHIVRKTAHFTMYTVLGLFSSIASGRKKLLSIRSGGVVLLCFIYACTDELHQYFVPGRSCMFTDVLLDTSGGFTGLLLSFLIFQIFKSYPFTKKVLYRNK